MNDLKTNEGPDLDKVDFLRALRLLRESKRNTTSEIDWARLYITSDARAVVQIKRGARIGLLNSQGARGAQAIVEWLGEVEGSLQFRRYYQVDLRALDQKGGLLTEESKARRDLLIKFTIQKEIKSS